MIHTIKNNHLIVKIDSLGAEFLSIKKIDDSFEYLWQGKSDAWNRRSPTLFPIVGGLKDKQYQHNGVTYSMPSHGFAQNSEFSAEQKTGDSITFVLTENEESLKMYPFRFRLAITYTVKDNIIEVSWKVNNDQDIVLPFSIGAHPGFNCPMNDGLKYSDYKLLFNKNESSKRIIKGEKLLTGVKEDFFDNKDEITLTHNLFDKGALIFDDLKSDVITLTSELGKKAVTMNFKGFPYYGIWKRPGTKAEYVCLEPWFGIDSTVGDSTEFTEKEGLIHLHPSDEFNSKYTIEIKV